MLRCLLFALLWGGVMIPVPALSAPLSLDEETMLREPDTDCTGPVLALDGLSSPLRLCAGSRSGDDPPEWLQSRIRQIRFMVRHCLSSASWTWNRGAGFPPMSRP